MSWRKITSNDLDKLIKVLDEYRRRLYAYNSILAPKGYKLKPVHIVVKNTSLGKVKYIYFGRYWYKVVYAGKSGKTSRVKWVYLGREKPDENLPDPPRHPLEGTVIRIDPTGIYVVSQGLR